MRRFSQYIEAAVGLGFRQSGHGSRGRTVGAGRRIQADGIRQSDGGRRIQADGFRAVGGGPSDPGRRVQGSRRGAVGSRPTGLGQSGLRQTGIGSRDRQSG
jgi:hypothetical protein